MSILYPRECGVLLNDGSQRCSTGLWAPETLSSGQKSQSYFHNSTKMLLDFLTLQSNSEKLLLLLLFTPGTKTLVGKGVGAIIPIQAVVLNYTSSQFHFGMILMKL